MLPFLILLLLPSCCGFSATKPGSKPIHQGVPSSNGDVKLGRKRRGVVPPVTHIKQASLWTGCLEWSETSDSVEWRGTLLFKKTEGKKGKMESHYRGLPVWDADLRLNLFSCLTSLSSSKTNRVTKRSNQTVMLDKYTCPLTGYTPPELVSPSTSKVRKITLFLYRWRISLLFPSGDCKCVLFQ